MYCSAEEKKDTSKKKTHFFYQGQRVCLSYKDRQRIRMGKNTRIHTARCLYAMSTRDRMNNNVINFKNAKIDRKRTIGHQNIFTKMAKLLAND
jgi:hypothetical protein